ncbi:MAG: type II toxin-antitoxin system MqsA family antitoxin [Acidobacteria bacterium]|nr:type II toxin-antitoxin system MqsA family antitoxin [Acidobacteriota bacterium]
MSVILEREQTTVIVKGVPADICRNCGEYWLEEEVAGRLLRQAEDAAARRAEVEIVRYAA